MNWIELIRAYTPVSEQEKKDQELILHCIGIFDDVLHRENGIAHMTSSAFVVNKARDKVLMVYHNIFDSWSWTGGHADGDEDLLAVAMREAREETGISNMSAIAPGIFALDVLPVLSHTRRGEYIPAHLHLTAAYLLEADEAEELVVKPDENSAVKWIPIDQVNIFSNEPHMKKVYEKLITKIKCLSSSNL